MNIRLSGVFVALLALAEIAHASDLLNGSFETGTFPTMPTEIGSAKLLPNSTVIGGWTVINHEIAWIDQGNRYGLTASDGNRFLDLTGWMTNGQGGVSQTISTIVGTHYRLAFDLGNSINYNYGNSNSLLASAGSTSSIFSNTNTSSTNSWQKFTLDFVARDINTNIEFRGNSSTHYIGLDNVTVTAVPETETYAMFLVGLGLMGGITRRRSKAK